MRVRATPEAAAELREARAWYRRHSRQSALDLQEAFVRARRQIGEHPLSGAEYLGNSRRVVLTDFPYVIIYRVLADEVRIIAVAHTSQRPGYWTGR